MTETEKKALALLNAVCAEWEVSPATEDDMDGSACFAALTRAIEQHEAFRQEVSDAVEEYFDPEPWNCERAKRTFSRFIIPKPDPLVEALEATGDDEAEERAWRLRAALAARGLEVRKIGEGE